MGYQVTITADTISELGGKLAALAAEFGPADPVMPEIKAPGKSTKAAAAPAAAKDTSSEATSGAASASAPKEEPQSSGSAPESTAADATSPVTDDMLRDLVVGLVKAKGREVMPPLLAQFGVAKATEITDPGVRLELANALRDAMGD